LGGGYGGEGGVVEFAFALLEDCERGEEALEGGFAGEVGEGCGWCLS